MTDREKHLVDLLRSVLMYDPEDVPLDKPLMARVREALTHTAVETPFEAELLGLLRQGASDPLNQPPGWKHAAYAVIGLPSGSPPRSQRRGD